MTKTYKFKARIEAADRGGACVVFPYDVELEFGTRGRVAVKASFDGVPYAGSLIRYGRPEHMLPILKAIREQIGKKPGDEVEIELQRDPAQRSVEVPPELAAALKEENLLTVFENLSYTHQREYCRWVSEAKREQTRQNRIVKSVAMLRNGVKTPDGASRS